MKSRLRIGERWIGDDEPVYFIAEIGANFDGDLEVAKALIHAAKESGADAAKFQTFTAGGLVSPHSFEQLNVGYQSKWDEPTYDVYKKAEFPRAWHKELWEYAKQQEIEFFTSVWDYEALDLMENLGANAYKIGSGDITWLDFIRRIAETGKPVLLSTGASTLADVDDAIRVIREAGNEQIVLMQCVTNYPSSHENANIRVLETYRKAFDVLLGYSDHSQGDVVPFGAVALGANVIEKHFTLNKKLPGPDHGHSMEASEFATMVARIRQLEAALGNSIKRVTDEERDSAIIMRRSLHAVRPLEAGEEITADKLVSLRPAVGILPRFLKDVVGRRLARPIQAKEVIRWSDLS